MPLLSCLYMNDQDHLVYTTKWAASRVSLNEAPNLYSYTIDYLGYTYSNLIHVLCLHIKFQFIKKIALELDLLDLGL